MSHTVVNLSNWPVSIRLNTGTTRHIPPDASLTGISSDEIEGNTRVEKLLLRRLIAVHEVVVPRSRDMNANSAIEHIRRAPFEELGDFVSAGEGRVTVLRAFKEKQRVFKEKSS